MPLAVPPLIGFQPLAVRALVEPTVTGEICLLGRDSPPPAAQAFRRAVAEAFA
ncbi:hypothetical protein [Streptomyces tibetensis]|uniref:hypothetical protein n=1 Tax=Streptomyces tibetensis TaxID=2382123 RepID=UPI00340F1530